MLTSLTWKPQMKGRSFKRRASLCIQYLYGPDFNGHLRPLCASSCLDFRLGRQSVPDEPADRHVLSRGRDALHSFRSYILSYLPFTGGKHLSLKRQYIRLGASNCSPVSKLDEVIRKATDLGWHGMIFIADVDFVVFWNYITYFATI